jgi:hypothetical protein
MANGYTDTDKGMKDILAEMKKLHSTCVKVGVTEDVGEKPIKRRSKGKSPNKKLPTLAQIATWNEFGVLAASRGVSPTEHGGGIWFIPHRPFVRGFADAKRDKIALAQEKLVKQVATGNLSAEDAIGRLGEFGEKGIKSYIRNGAFIENAVSTKAKKKSSKPLIDTGTLRNSIRYQIIHEPVDKAGA